MLTITNFLLNFFFIQCLVWILGGVVFSFSILLSLVIFLRKVSVSTEKSNQVVSMGVVGVKMNREIKKWETKMTFFFCTYCDDIIPKIAFYFVTQSIINCRSFFPYLSLFKSISSDVCFTQPQIERGDL